MSEPATIPLYQRISHELSRLACVGRPDIIESAYEALIKLEKLLPSGSGIDAGSIIDTQKSTPDHIDIRVAFHHMNDAGMYAGWTDHNVIVTPSLAWGFILKVTGRDRNGIKEYLGDVYSNALSQLINRY